MKTFKTVLKIGGIVMAALVLIAGVGFVLRRQSSPSSAAVATEPTVTVTRGSIEETVSATGNVVAERQATLAFELSGRITEVLVKEGQQVEAGQVLARLDTASLEWQVAVAEAGLATAQGRLAQVQEPPSEEDLASARAALDKALAGYEDVKDGPAAAEIASARAAVASAKANYQDVKDGPTEEELASAKAVLDSAEAALEQAQAKYDEVKHMPNIGMLPQSLDLENATIEVERAQANYDELANHPTESELASAAAQVASAEAALAGLLDKPTEAELASAAAQVASAEATLADLLDRPDAEDVAVYQAEVEEAALSLAQAEDQLQDALIIAPFDGTVLEVLVEEGEWATTGSPAILLAAPEPLILDLDVDEVDVAQIAEGQTAYLSFDALDDAEVAGTVTYIAPSSTDVSGAVAYGVEISFDPGVLPIRLGMTADVDIVVARADDALLVPNRAVEADREAGRYYVTRQKAGGTTERLEVRIGLRDGSQTEILEGLSDGDRLVLPQVAGQDGSEEAQAPGLLGGMRPGGRGP
ncbi:MAG: efflux RND transporter periplasmic adaptor subunit [Chloroflexi bacterium]|nr:efflux RND transporter periplasmic adaptor subunit [Chloroflexota bacterium]